MNGVQKNLIIVLLYMGWKWLGKPKSRSNTSSTMTQNTKMFFGLMLPYYPGFKTSLFIHTPGKERRKSNLRCACNDCLVSCWGISPRESLKEPGLLTLVARVSLPALPSIPGENLPMLNLFDSDLFVDRYRGNLS